MNDSTITRPPKAGTRNSARAGGQLSAAAAIPTVECRRDLPLSFAQERLWFLAQMEGGNKAYQSLHGFRLQGELDRAALRQALTQIVARHEALRTNFTLVDGKPLQHIVGKRDSQFHLIEHDLRGCDGTAAEIERLITEEAGTPIDLEVGPLIRGRLIRQGVEEYVLLITIHHIVSDAWSFGVFSNELSALYRAYVRGEEDGLSELEIQYADYAVWQRKWMEGEVLGRQAEYWKRILAGAPEVLQLPTDRARPEQQSYSGATARLVLGEELTAGLRGLSRKHRTTLYMTVLTGWAALLARLSGQDDVVIGTPAANRNRVEIEGLIGFFVNTLALRLGVSGSSDVGELMAHIKSQAVAAQENQGIPFEQVVEIVRPLRSLAHNPVFQVMFAWQNAPKGTINLPGLEVSLFTAVPHDISKFDLTLSLQKEGNQIVGEVEYATALYERSTIERYFGYFRNLLGAMVADDNQKVGRLPMLGQEERDRVVYEWNDTERAYPGEQCVHELFEKQVGKTPEAVAVVFGEEELSYGELNRRANQLAHYLRELGVKPEERVAICVERSLEMVVGLLGVMKAGGAYVPMDVAYPIERLRFMLEDSQAGILITNRSMERRLAEARGSRVWAEEMGEMVERYADADVVGSVASANLAHIIYTSGSSGRPKAVAGVHAAVVNRLQAEHEIAPWGKEDICCQKTPLGFVDAVAEIWGPLLQGRRLVVASEEEASNPEELLELIRKQEITRLVSVPALARAMMENPRSERALKGLRQWTLSGEALSSDLLRQLQGRLPQCRLFNLYGSSEVAADATWYAREEVVVVVERDTVPIGRPIANMQVYVLDSYLEPVPVGVVGELYVGGEGVARGYLRQSDLTAERFVANEYGREGSRLYRTGDRGRYLCDGNLKFIGRVDAQVKVRGYRIELGEIEARLREREGVREAVVVAREEEGGEKRLVAYYTRAAAVGAEQLREHLAASLPEYMVPAAYVGMERMPLTANGKLDRKALPAPEGDAYVVREYEEPEGEMEESLAGIWAEVLHVERVGRQDNFFELGGHSLLAVRVIARVREALKVEVGIRDLFAHSVLRDFASGLAVAAPAELPPINRANRGKRIPLSLAQQRLWFLAQMEGVREAYHIRTGLYLKGKLNRAALRWALDRIVERHEALRTTFAFVDGEPVQQIAPAEESRFHLTELDLRHHTDTKEELKRVATEESGVAFNLEAGPLIRGQLIRQSEVEYVLQLTMHHIISDGWSMGLLVNELSALYGAYVKHEADPLPDLKLQYADYAIWQRTWMEGDVLRKQAEYWEKTLTGAPEVLQLPTDHVRPEQQSYSGTVANLALDEELTEGLRGLSRKHRTTLYMTLLAGWAALLARLSGQDDVVIGTPVANRNRVEIEGLIGFFVNTLALRLAVSGTATVGELLERVKGQVLSAQEHEEIPFEQVVEIVRPPRSLAHNPVFQVMFVWQNAPKGTLKLPGLQVSPFTAVPHDISKFDLMLLLGEDGNRIVGWMEYATALYKTATIKRYLGYFRTLLGAMVADDSQKLDRLPMLPQAERRQLLYEWNATEVEYPRDKCVHKLFEEQVEKSSDAVSVAFESEFLSYAGLNQRANQLAHYLRELGVKPEERVGICVERSVEMVVGVVGVLKAGGAYVPLDPGYPAERLRYMIEDSAPVVLLTQTRLENSFVGSSDGRPIVVLDSGFPGWMNLYSDHNPRFGEIGVTAQNLACIIYTSGSTGKSKGVAVLHGGIVNLVHDWITRFGDMVERDAVQASLWTSFGFDVSIFELFAGFFLNATVNIVPEQIRGDSRALFAWFVTHNIGFGYLPPFFIRDAQHTDATISPLPFELVLVGVEPSMESALYQLQRNAPRLQVVNGYGPAETTVFSTTYAEIGNRLRNTPIGRPMTNTRIYILDGQGEPVPVGVTGELYIGGAGVARGYLNRPELTAERFMWDPFAAEAGARMYKTGDLGRWLGEGNIEFLGRNDFQVKVRGFRIELGEIEARLRESEGVGEAVVAAREDRAGEKRLVAYYTVREQSSGGAQALRAHLAAKLPEYMVPAAYVRLESLPLTPSGKLDWKALPAPEGDAYVVREYEEPLGVMEELLAGIWAEVLHVERVGRQDNFLSWGALAHGGDAGGATCRGRIEGGCAGVICHTNFG